ncbi:hypothetical protein [Nocardioides sp. MH1]|uniref:hypothetical protein n=1 Tax=Nocardioides sp. MH1 TaxID=3242490 RepID=UPI0035201690
MRARKLAVASLCAAVALGATAMDPSAHAAPDRSATAEHVSTRGSTVHLTSKTVVVSRKVARQQLTSVSKDGGTYKFRSAVGPLGKLRAGKVLLITGLAARDVTKVTKKRGHLTVVTTPAQLTDVVKDGTLSLAHSIDFSKGLVAGGAAVPPERSALRRSLPERFGLQPLEHRAALTVKGKVKGYAWKAVFTPSKTGVGVEVTITRSSDVELSVTIKGTLDDLKTGGSIAVDGGELSKASMVAKNIQGSFSLKYAAKPLNQFGLGDAGGIKVELPAEILVPFTVGPVPFFVGVRVAFFASAGFSNFDQELSGEWTMKYDGAGGITTSSDGATSPAGALDGLAKIILGAANAVNQGPLSFVFGAQMPQLQLGMGIKGFNVAGNVTLVGTTQISTTGPGCDTRKMRILGTTGASASFFGLSADLGTQNLFDKTIQAAWPTGCGTPPRSGR